MPNKGALLLSLRGRGSRFFTRFTTNWTTLNDNEFDWEVHLLGYVVELLYILLRRLDILVGGISIRV